MKRGFSFIELLIVIAIFLIIAAIIVPSTNKHTSRPTPRAHWKDAPHWADGTGRNDVLTCDDSGKVIATVSRGGTLPNDTFGVFGGNGAGYGEYTTEDAAKARAMEVVTAWWQESELTKCP